MTFGVPTWDLSRNNIEKMAKFLVPEPSIEVRKKLHVGLPPGPNWEVDWYFSQLSLVFGLNDLMGI